MELTVREYVRDNGISPFGRWFERLNSIAAARVAAALARLQTGNFSNAKSLGSGVYELRIDFGPGYRIYYGYERVDFPILLIGGTKKKQQQDIRSARSFWREYKAHKGSGKWLLLKNFEKLFRHA